MQVLQLYNLKYINDPYTFYYSPYMFENKVDGLFNSSVLGYIAYDQIHRLLKRDIREQDIRKGLQISSSICQRLEK